MKRIIILVYLLNVAQAYGQYVSELSVFEQAYVYYNIRTVTDQWQILSTGLQYKHSVNDNICYRLSIDWVRFGYGYNNLTYYNTGRDSGYSKNFSATLEHIPAISGGLEWQHKLFGNVKWCFGGDINAGYNPGRKDSSSYFIGSYTYTKGQIDSVVQKGNRRENILYTSIRPFAGIKATYKRVSVGLEAATMLMEDVFIINKRTSTEMICGGIDAQVYASYHFNLKRDKPSKVKSE